MNLWMKYTILIKINKITQSINAIKNKVASFMASPVPMSVELHGDEMVRALHSKLDVNQFVLFVHELSCEPHGCVTWNVTLPPLFRLHEEGNCFGPQPTRCQKRVRSRCEILLVSIVFSSIISVCRWKHVAWIKQVVLDVRNSRRWRRRARHVRRSRRRWLTHIAVGQELTCKNQERWIMTSKWHISFARFGVISFPLTVLFFFTFHILLLSFFKQPLLQYGSWCVRPLQNHSSDSWVAR